MEFEHAYISDNWNSSMYNLNIVTIYIYILKVMHLKWWERVEENEGLKLYIDIFIKYILIFTKVTKLSDIK